MSEKFSIICADPPFLFQDALKHSDVKRGASSNYDTMTLEDIKNLPINKISDPNGALLALWVPSSMLQDGLDIMKKWGFTQKQTYVWVKTKNNPFKALSNDLIEVIKFAIDLLKKDISFYKSKSFSDIVEKFFNINYDSLLGFGMGRLFRNCHEICLIGTNNNKIYKELQNKSQRTVSLAPNLKHSAKPENLQDALDLMFDGKKIELFARRARNGWITIGNESPSTMGEDIRISLQKLID